MQKTIFFLLSLFAVAISTPAHPKNTFSQIQATELLDGTESPLDDTFISFGIGESFELMQAPCDRDENNLNVTECLDWIRKELYGDTDYNTFNWRFKGQIDCWIKYSEEFGIEYFEDMVGDPFMNSRYAFHMPNTRLYEHFYNDEGCNQIWRMGRGRDQPDAITFYDVHIHEYNTILSLNRIQVTPWVSHDQMVIQMFGITERCVRLYTDVEAMGRGLVPGQFRIEYYNSTGLTYIDSSDFGQASAFSPAYAAGTTNTQTDILQSDVCICRTPHYLQVCLADHCNGCEVGCEYFPAFTSSDDSLYPFSHYGNYTVPCNKGDVFTFNGTASGTSHLPKIKNLIFEDKCEADTFILLDGQTIVIKGNLTGSMEVVIQEDNCFTMGGNACITTVWNIFEVWDGAHHDQTTVPNPIQLTHMVVKTASHLVTPIAGHTSTRTFVFAKWGTFDLCPGECDQNVAAAAWVCDSVITTIFDTSIWNFVDDPDDPLFGQWVNYMYLGMTATETSPAIVGIENDKWFHGRGDALAAAVVAGDDWINTGLGDDIIPDAGLGDDILEDHGGRDELHGMAGNDILISRSGGDKLYGGGHYATHACTSGTTMDSRAMPCSAYVGLPWECGIYDDPDFSAFDDCCECWGGEFMRTDVEETPMETEFHCNTYVIYPTHEKDHHFDWIPWNLADDAAEQLFTCTKIYGMDLDDTIEFRMDDHHYEDYKYTNDDDNCVLRVDGWEIEWYLGNGTDINYALDTLAPYVEDQSAQGGNAAVPRYFVPNANILDVWFSRKTQMAHICMNKESDSGEMMLYDFRCSGGPDGEVSNDYCLAYWVRCDDLDPWPEIDLDGYAETLDLLNWYGFW